MAKITHIIPGLTNGVTYYGKVFSVNPKKRANGRADLTVFAAIPSAFPAEPTDYTLIAKYTTSQTWVAPEDGWFKIEVHGASGKGGSAARDTSTDDDDNTIYQGGSGAGGGGSAYVCSAVKLKKGDVIALVCGAVGSDTTATVTSSVETYGSMKATSGANGGSAWWNNGFPNGYNGGTGGVGGTASGGNVSNVNGGKGSNGSTTDWEESKSSVDAAGGTGGAPGHSDGNHGGTGGYLNNYSSYSAASGAAGFIKISRGNTNL